MLFLVSSVDFVAWGAAFASFAIGFSKVKMEVCMTLNAEIMAKVLLAVAWSLVGNSTPCSKVI